MLRRFKIWSERHSEYVGRHACSGVLNVQDLQSFADFYQSEITAFEVDAEDRPIMTSDRVFKTRIVLKPSNRLEAPCS